MDAFAQDSNSTASQYPTSVVYPRGQDVASLAPCFSDFLTSVHAVESHSASVGVSYLPVSLRKPGCDKPSETQVQQHL